MRHSTFSQSGVLVLGSNSVQSLLPSTLISQAESLLHTQRIEDAIQLANLERQRQQQVTPSAELCYVYQRIGFQCLSERLFEEAGEHLFTGGLDPRVLVGYFPGLRGSLFSATDEIDVFAGVAEYMPQDSLVDEEEAAKDMVLLFLRKWRSKMSADEGPKAKAVSEVVDTVLAKLFAQSENTTDLFALLQQPNDIILNEIETPFRETGQYSALCLIYKQRGDDEKLLETWAKIADGQWTSGDISDPVSEMFALLSEKRHRALINHWAVWLTKKDPDRALKLLTSKDSSKRRGKVEDDLDMLRQLMDADLSAGTQYLEYLVLQKRSTARELHTELATSCIDQLLTAAANESVAELWRAKAASYASSNIDGSFLSYFASTTPDSDHKRVRLKTVLLLQGSTLYEPEPIRERLLKYPKILELELAIINGKLGDHRAALTTLVRGLRDATSAEAYCTLGGDVVPAKTAEVIGEQYNLQQWASTLFPLPGGATAKSTGKPVAMCRQKSVSEDVKRALLKILLEVYMGDGDDSADHTAHLLNSQAMNLEVFDVITLVPPNWPLNAMTSFLARSFRRALHTHHEGQIVKAISAGQNLEVKDETWAVLREQGAIVEEAAEEDDGDGGGEVKLDEKDVISEKIALHLQDVGRGRGGSIGGKVVEITAGEGEEGTRNSVDVNDGS